MIAGLFVKLGQDRNEREAHVRRLATLELKPGRRMRPTSTSARNKSGATSAIFNARDKRDNTTTYVAVGLQNRRETVPVHRQLEDRTVISSVGSLRSTETPGTPLESFFFLVATDSGEAELEKYIF